MTLAVKPFSQLWSRHHDPIGVAEAESRQDDYSRRISSSRGRLGVIRDRLGRERPDLMPELDMITGESSPETVGVAA